MVVCLLLFCFSSFANAEQKNDMTSCYNAEFALNFKYPVSWEFQIVPSADQRCKYEIRLRPPSWLAHLATAEYRRSSSFPLQILLCPKDFESFAGELLYEKKEDGWGKISKGSEMYADDIKGANWHGIVGDILINSIMRSGERGPVMELQQALISTGKNKTVLILMEYTSPEFDNWSIDDLLDKLQITANGKETVYKTSYDCKKAGLDIEKIICWNHDLARADLELGQIYKRVFDSLPKHKRKQLLDRQKQWMERRNSQCPPSEFFECLKKTYSDRIKELKEISNTE